MTLTSSYQKVAEKYLGNTGYGNVYLRLYARVSSNGPDIANNKTKVYVDPRIYTASWFTVSSGTTNVVSFSGSNSSGTRSCNRSYEVGETSLGVLEGYVGHYDDGTRTIHAEATFKSSPWGWNGTASVEGLVLPTIPRASDVACSSPNIGDTATITISRKSTTFRSTVSYVIGSLSGTIATKTNDTVLSLPTSDMADSIYSQIPNTKEKQGTITCQTYNGNTLIGTKTCTFNVYAKESVCKPTVSGTVIDTNTDTIALTGDSSKFIKYISKPKITINATPNKSSTIKSYSTNLNDGQTSTTKETTFNSIGSNSISINTIDSRGYGNPQEIALDMVDYVQLHLNQVDIYREEDTSTEFLLTGTGEWFNSNFNENTANTLSINFQYRKTGDTEWTSGGTITPTINGNNITFNDISLGNNYSYEEEYQFKIVATDLLMTVGNNDKEIITAPKGIALVETGEGFVNINGTIMQNDRKIIDSDNTWLYLNGVIRYRKKNGIVFITGDSANEVQLSPKIYNVVGTLPEGYRPSRSITITLGLKGTSDSQLTAYIGTDGKINLYTSVSTKYWRCGASFPVD